MTSDIVFVYVTAPSQDVAEKIATAAVDARLAACANMLSGMQSLYRWQGKIERAAETVLIFKTRTVHAVALQALIVSLHPYEVPCVAVLPVTAGHAPYLDWIAAETAAE
ncbi:MAG: divalent-cation tolerance protein CutA [Alphaproteobacteria bacterium]